MNNTIVTLRQIAISVIFSALASQSIIAQTCFTPPSAIVSWWRAETNANDSVGGNNGTLENGAGFATGEVGFAFSFGTNNAHVRVPDAANLRFTNAMTIEAWIFPTNIGSDHQMVTKWDTVVGTNQRSYSSSVGSDGKPYFTVSPDGTASGNGVVFATTEVTNNVWTHFAATYDGTTLKLYLNGALNNAVTYTNGIFAGTDDLGIGGAVGNEAPGGVIFPFEGLMDEVTLYKRALLDCEIEAIYNAGSAGKCHD